MVRYIEFKKKLFKLLPYFEVNPRTDLEGLARGVEKMTFLKLTWHLDRM